MPTVGKMKFPYTKRGMEDAQAYASQSGKRMEVESYQYGGRVPRGRGMNPGILQALMNRLKGRR